METGGSSSLAEGYEATGGGDSRGERRHGHKWYS
jgi:hypothetical protein